MKRIVLLLVLGGCATATTEREPDARIDRICGEGSGCECMRHADLRLVERILIESGERILYRGERLTILGLPEPRVDVFEVVVTVRSGRLENLLAGTAQGEIVVLHNSIRESTAPVTGGLAEVPSGVPHPGWWRVRLN